MADTLPARWYDGMSSHAREVVLRRPGPDRLQIVAADGQVEEWPLAEIRIDSRLGNAPRVLRRAGHGQLECEDSPLLAEWFVNRGSKVEAWADWLERHRGAIAASIAIAVAGVVFTLKFGVPWLAQRVAAQVPEAAETVLSDQVVVVLEKVHLRPSKLAGIRQQELQRQFAALVAGEPRHERMRLLFADARGMGPNAFALPDGRIYLTDALVELAGDDAEILAVLAHEAGHHVHRHGLRQGIESSAVVLAAGVAFGDVSGSSLAVTLPTVLLQSGFSRGHEREADAYAVDLMRRQGKDPLAFARIMRRLQAARPALEKGVAGYLSTHPPTPERIRAAEQAAAAP